MNKLYFFLGKLSRYLKENWDQYIFSVLAGIVTYIFDLPGLLAYIIATLDYAIRDLKKFEYNPKVNKQSELESQGTQNTIVENDNTAYKHSCEVVERNSKSPVPRRKVIIYKLIKYAAIIIVGCLLYEAYIHFLRSTND